jgi:hypothetical protein
MGYVEVIEYLGSFEQPGPYLIDQHVYPPRLERGG